MIKQFFQTSYDEINNIVKKIDNNKYLLIILFILISLFILKTIGLSIISLLLIILTLVFYYKPHWSLYFLLSFIPIKALIKSSTIIPTESLTYFVPVVLLVTFISFVKTKRIKLNNIDIILLLILIASIVSSIGFVFLYGFRSTIFLDFFIWLQLIGFYLIGKYLNEENLKNISFVNIFIVNLVSLWAIIEFFVIKNTPYFVETYELIKGRANGPLENPNALAGYLLLSGVFFFTNYKNERNKLPLLILPFIAFVLTFSRGALIILIGIILLQLFLNKKFKYIIMGLAGGLLLFAFAPKTFQTRITNIFNPEHFSYSADSGRIWSFRNVFYINQNHFLFGNGWGSYGGEYAYGKASPTYLEGAQNGVVGVGNTDNQWLQIYAQQGIVGLMLYLLLLIELIKNKKNKYFILLIGYFALGLFIDIFQFYQISFLPWLILATL